MRPDQHLLHHDERAGINDVFRTEQRVHKRDDQDTRVGVDNGGAFDHIQMQRTGKQAGEQQKQDVRRDRNGEGEDKPGHDLRRVFDLESVDDDAGREQVYHDDR